MSINSNQIIKRPDVVINPNFFLPPGVIDARYPNEAEINSDDVDIIIDSDTSDLIDTVNTEGDTVIEGPGTIGEDNDVAVLYPPDTVIVVSQTVRFSDTGQQVVDVVLEVPDVQDSIQVDVRMTKA